MGDIMNEDFIITGIARIVFVGAYEYPEEISTYESKMHHQELIYNLSGEHTVYFGDKVLKSKPETIRYLPKGDFSKYIVKRKSVGECIDIVFDSNIPFGNVAFIKKATNNKQLELLFKKAFSSWVKHTETGKLEAMSYLYKIISILKNELYIPETKYKTLKPAIDYINENLYKGQISYKELAEVCEISESYLKRLFTECYKLPPKKYINNLKMNLACDLLMEHTYTVTQIAANVGFENVYYFSRAFKEHIGLTPTEFRKKYISSK